MRNYGALVLMLFGITGSGAGQAAEPAKAKENAPPAAVAKPARQAAARSARAAADRLDLDTTVVTGNRELPKVLYIVPWKKAEIGDLPEQPFNSLLDEALTPIDRDEFRREVSYYSKLLNRPAPVAGGRTDKAVTAPPIAR